ncbi:unnamed protein product [Psylliodes chrysocephalus]|uniref:Peptidase S1 domain-containing protein n=1 Tax=Psylliodes chrysocephalus TaxID=3402493 RepID=A0A9P0D593_9CUCU|nr:unnamed protein product [Psylliodes chrysocephala]
MFSAKVVVFLAAVSLCYGAPNAILGKHQLNIQNAVDAKIEDYPFVVSVQVCFWNGCEHYCGGIIINENWILTAVRCIENHPTIAVGATDLHSNDTVFVEAVTAIVHPDFSEGCKDVIELSYCDWSKSTISGPNDLALIKLATPLTFNDKVQAAKLPTQGQEFTGKAVVTGYSYTRDNSVNTLKAAADLELISNTDCVKRVNIFYPDQDEFDTEGNMCTLGENSNICYADFGSPVSQDGTVIGIATWYVYPCSSKGAPNVSGPNDLALIKLATPLTFNDKVQAAKLPTQGQEFTGKAVVTGYSYTRDNSVNTLKAAADLELISNTDCVKRVNIFYPDQDEFDTEGNMCTLGETSNICYADFGSPVSQDGTVIGIATWYVYPCSSKGAPNVYTKLSHYADWIAQTVAAN